MPSRDDVSGAREELKALYAWVMDVGLPELPPEHHALATAPFGIRLSLARLGHRAWGEVFFSQHTATGLGTLVRWRSSEGQREVQRFLSPGAAWAMTSRMVELMRRLRGDEIELHYALSATMPLLPRGTWVHPDGWWDEWKSRRVSMEEDAPTLGHVYASSMYPRVMGVLQRLAARGHDVERIVDVCGGDGDLASQILAWRPACRVTVMERNAFAAEQAARVSEGRADVVLADASTPDAWEGLAALDVALLVGAIQGNVMSAEAGERTMRHVYGALRPGGFAVVTGWSACLLDSASFRALGFEVLNMAVPPTSHDPNARQLYLLRRAV